MGVQYVIVHLQNLSGPQRTDFEWRATSPDAKVLADFALVKDFGSDRVYEVKGPDDIDTLKDLIPPSEPVLLADPGLDPERKTGALVYSGYLATVGWFLRDRPLFGDSRLSFGQTIEEVDPARLPPYAVLWANEDPARAGYSGASRLWSNEFIALYRARAAGAQGSPR
jgi:hypothetical protein